MACPTCDHTMQNIGDYDATVFWCPRCGVVKGVNGDTYTPSLLDYASSMDSDSFKQFINVDILKRG